MSISNRLGFGQSKSIFDLEEEHQAERLKQIAEAVYASIDIQKEILTKFIDSDRHIILMLLSSKKLRKKDLCEIEWCLQDLRWAAEQPPENDNRMLIRGAIDRLLTIYVARKDSPREHFLKSLGGFREDKDAIEEEITTFE